MTDITMNVDDLVAALSAGSNRDLGTVLLRNSFVPVNESTPPALPITVPVVMSSFNLVPSDTYKFFYSKTRFLKLYYILERSLMWEVGELLILNSASTTSDSLITPPSESTPPVVPTDPSAPTIYVRRHVLMWTNEDQDSGAIGVDLSVIQDPTTTNKGMMFGIAYKITDANPAVFPMIRAAIAVEMPAVIPPQT